jgi:hypothetical protein
VSPGIQARRAKATGLMAIGPGIVLAASVLARVPAFWLIALAAAGGLSVTGLAGYAVIVCRRYQQASAPGVAPCWSVVPADSPRPVNADPVPLRQAITELQARLLAVRGALPAVDRSQHQHLHLHGLTPEQVAAIMTKLQDRHHPEGWQDGGSQ